MHDVPYLRSGIGDSPRNGGCILQVIDWIHRHEWTDDPDCVHPLLRGIAIGVNDLSADSDRQRLLGFTNRLMGTTVRRYDSILLDSVINYTAKRRFLARRHSSDVRDLRFLNLRDTGWETDIDKQITIAAQCFATAQAGLDLHQRMLSLALCRVIHLSGGRDEQMLDFLTHALDEYDVLTERVPSTDPVDYSGVCQVMGTPTPA